MNFLRSLVLLFPALLTGAYVISTTTHNSVANVDTSLVTLTSSPTGAAYALARAPGDAMHWSYNKTFLTALVLITNSYILAASCAVAGPLTCLIVAVYSAATFYFAAYQLAGRGLIPDDEQQYFRYAALPDKTHVQRLTTELEPGVWHNIGWSHVSGNNHTMLYFNHGDYHTIRAWQQLVSTTAIDFVQFAKRQAAEGDDGGFIVDYHWDSNQEKAYDDFHSNSDEIHYYADNLGGYMFNTEQSIVTCANFGDQDGNLDTGLVSVGWNNQPFEFSEGEEGSFLSGACQNT